MRHLLLLTLMATSAARAADAAPTNQDCLGCHESAKHGEADSVGRPGVVTALFGKSVHASLDCVACHAKVVSETQKKFTHLPFVDPKGCEACHKRHGLVGANVLRESEPKLCYGCHEPESKRFAQAHVHAPVKSGTCTVCHAAHSSDFPKLVKVSGNAACLGCHKPGPFTEGRVHAPVAKSCATCHEAHAGAEAKLLVKPEQQLCLGCHDVSRNAKWHGGYDVSAANSAAHVSMRL